MREIDRMDVIRYLGVLAYEIKDARRVKQHEQSGQPGGGVLLSRGSVDMLW